MDGKPMRNPLLILTIGAGALLAAGCFTEAIIEKEPPAVATAQASASEIATPEMSPDVNFKSSNAAPSGPGL
jgi:hypothetical protein